MTKSRDISSGLVFLSGGTALNKFAEYLVNKGISAAHLISVFDDGGSTARLRSLTEIAIGDLRNRLIAISSPTDKGNQSIRRLFSERFHGNKPNSVFRQKALSLVADHPMTSDLPKEDRETIETSLKSLIESVPSTFDWSDASVGNLIIAGLYIASGKSWEATFVTLHKLIRAIGRVVPVTYGVAYLAAFLTTGNTPILGQSQITDERDPLREPIKRLFLSKTDETWVFEATPAICNDAKAAIDHASVIVYSWGSFYTSILPCILVDGVSDSIRSKAVPKIFLINPSRDCETIGKSPVDLIIELIHYATEKCGSTDCKASDFVTHAVFLVPAQAELDWVVTSEDEAELANLGISTVKIECDGLPSDREFEILVELFKKSEG